VASPDVPDDGMADNDHPGVPVLLAAAHRPPPRLQPPTVGLNLVVGILLGSTPRCRQQLLEHHRVRGRLVGRHLNGGHLGRADRLLQEPTGRLGVLARCYD
jgi:hypothetical protein